MTRTELIALYLPALVAATGAGLLFMLQTLVGAITRARAKQPGGLPIRGGHERLVWRVDRARSNTIEVLGGFTLLLGLALIVGAEPPMVNIGAGLFACARLAHMICYYANAQIPRIVSFLVTNIALIVLMVSVVRRLVALV